MKETNDQKQTGIELWTVAFVFAEMVALIVLPAAAKITPWLAIVIAIACCALVPAMAKRLPAALASAFQRRKALSIVWIVLALFGLLQIGRLSQFMADPSRTWGSAVPDPGAIGHQCLSAYVQAADLARRGEKNLYAEQFYPAFLRLTNPHPDPLPSPVTGLSKYLEDPFQYPPQFLLLPGFALAMTNNFMTIRTCWFVLQSLTLLCLMLLLARWIGGREGVLVGLLIPALYASMPFMFNFQFGQFHAMSVALAVAGLVLFENKSVRTGGALLGFSIVAKIFPSILLIYLAWQKKWREIGWTLFFICLYTLITAGFFGATPLYAFLTFELPRFANEQAFTFAWNRDFPLFFITRNFSIEGFLMKLQLLKIGGIGPATIHAAQWIYSLLLIWFAYFAASVRHPESRLRSVQIWLALLTLASFRTPLVPAFYAMAPTLFLLCLVAPEIRGRWKYAVLITVFWLVIMGGPPLPDNVEIVLDLIGQTAATSVSLWTLLRRPEPLSSEAVDYAEAPLAFPA